jgi:hypothetical protein
MTRFIAGALAACALLAAAPHAYAAQLCAWMTEKLGEDDYHEVALWLEADEDFDGYYKIQGEGFTSEGMRAHSPGSGTFVLHAKKPDKPWGFGATVSGPGQIDIIAEVHKYPKDVFADEPPPLIASFTFHRDVPEGETKAPATFAAKQCQTVAPSHAFENRD